eukprot:gene10279-biopygen10284
MVISSTFDPTGPTTHRLAAAATGVPTAPGTPAGDGGAASSERFSWLFPPDATLLLRLHRFDSCAAGRAAEPGFRVTSPLAERSAALSSGDGFPPTLVPELVPWSALDGIGSFGGWSTMSTNAMFALFSAIDTREFRR